MRRAFAVLLSISLGFLAGCGGSQFQGSLGGRNGNGPNPPNGIPDPAPGQAQVTTVSPRSVVAGGPSFTMTVNGLNLLPTNAVLWNDGIPLTTTYISSTVLKAQVPASLITRPGSVTIAPSPMGTFNYVGTFTITVAPLQGNQSFSISMVPVQANDLAWDPTSQQLYLAVASGNATSANSITALNPQTGALGSSISTGSEPGRLSISSDGAYIYAAVKTAGTVQRYALPGLQHDLDIPLGSGFFGAYFAIDLAAQPGSPRSVAISRGTNDVSPTEQGGVLIYDDATARPQSIPGAYPGPIDSLFWNSNGQVLYGVDTETSPALYLYTMSASSAGVQLQSNTVPAATHFDATTGYLYSDPGKVIDPATGAVIGIFPTDTVQGGFDGAPLMVTDGQLNIAYFLGRTNDGGSMYNYALEAYDLTSFRLLGSIPILNMAGTPSRMVRWGSNGLAILTGDARGKGAPGDGVYLVSGAFVTSPAP